MNFRYLKPIKIIAYILTALFLIGAIWYGWSNRQIKINHLQAEVNILWNYKLNEPGLKERINTLTNENMQLKQQLENLNIHYKADELFITYAKSEYLKAMTYITVSEAILQAQGIEYLYLGDRRLEKLGVEFD